MSVRIRGERSSPAGASGLRRGFVDGAWFRRACCSRSTAWRCAGSLKLIHQAQAGHGVLGVADGGGVLRRDFQAREFFGKRRAAYEQRNVNAGFAQIGGGDDHLLRAFYQQAGKADGVGLMFAMGANQFLGRNFDAEVDHVVAVIFQNDLDEIFADVVDVALHRGEHYFGALFGVGFLHELFEMADGGFHGFGGLQNFGDDQLVVVEQPADFGHSGHQRAVDDVERRVAFGAFAIEIVNQAVFGAFENVIREALVERQVGGASFFREPEARKCSVMAAM